MNYKKLNKIVGSDPLLEATRTQLISKSKSSDKGKQRYNRRTKSRIGNSVKEYNSMDMNKLFKDNILTVNINVIGETDNYVVKISFGGFLDFLYEEINRSGKLDLRSITRALVRGFNQDNVYVHCSCPDSKFRFQYWQTRNDYNSGEPQNDNGKWIRNPDDKLGSACKHVLLVLSNNSWLIKVGSVINNYIKYAQQHMKKAYADIIYPAIYREKYVEPVQTSMFDDDELESEEETIDISNEEGRTRGQFKPGNEYRFKKREVPKDQIEIDTEEETEA